MIKRYVCYLAQVFLIWLVGTLVASAQSGNLFLHNYNIPINGLVHSNVAVQQGSEGVIYFANTKGILAYDGADWRMIKTPATPYALASGKENDNRLYVGCRNNFGYLAPDEEGKPAFVSWSGSQKDVGNITRIVITGAYGYFFSAQTIYQIVLESGEVKHTYKPIAGQLFTSLFALHQHVYTYLPGKGLQQLTEGRLLPVQGTQVLGDAQLVSQIPFNENQVLLGTHTNRLYLFNGKSLIPYVIQGKNYLETNVLSGGTTLSPTTFALSTVSGGCLVIEKKTGKTLHIVNFQTDLPDDEVLAVGTDRQGGLWICHPLGISRADTRLPLENFSSYPGLVGNLTQVLHLNNLLYVATTEGVFYLDKVDNYNEVFGLVKQQRQIQQLTKTIKITESQKGLDLGFLNPLFGTKKKRKVETSQKVDLINVDNTPAGRQKEIYALQSIPYIFKRVEGFTGKCKQLITFNGLALAAGTNGIFQIMRDNARLILPSQYVNFAYPSPDAPNCLYVGTSAGLFAMKYQAGQWTTTDYTSQVNAGVYYISENKKTLWLGGENQVIRLGVSASGALTVAKRYPVTDQYVAPIPVYKVEGQPAFLLASGVHVYDAQKDQLVPNEEAIAGMKADMVPVYGQQDLYWIPAEGRWKELSQTLSIDPAHQAFLNLFDKIGHVFIDSQRHIWLTSGNNSLYKIDGKRAYAFDKPPVVFLNQVTDKAGRTLPPDDVEVDYDQNALNFALSTRYYGPEAAVQYQFKIDGIGNAWSNWSNKAKLEFPVLPNGSYTLSVRARDASGQTGEESAFSFTVHPPFWKSWWFRMLLIIGLVAGVYAFVQYRTHRLEEANRVLETKVQERTAEIVRQKDQIAGQKQALEVAYTDIEKKNHHITGSINYARKIQQAILPVQGHIQEAFKEAFVLFKPRDIVSGDFYWFSEKEEYIIMAAVDCTGHGVPGAFMSMIGNTLLNQIVNEKNITQPAQILNQLHKGVRKALKQEAENSERQDGMDIAICTLHKRTRELQFAGANNPLYLIRNGVLEEVKANKFAIGGIQKEAERQFTNHTFLLTETTHCYLFSDGFVDQFGGPDNKKFMSKRFKQLLVDIHHKPATEQQEVLHTTIEQWKGLEPQIDDILVIGFQITVGVQDAQDATTLDIDTKATQVTL